MKRFLFLFVLLLIGVGIEAKPVAPYLDVGEKFILGNESSEGVVICEQVAILEFSFIDRRAGLAQIGVDIGEYRLSPILDVQADGLSSFNEMGNAERCEHMISSLQKADTKSRTGFMGFGIGQINQWTITGLVGIADNEVFV